MGNTIKNRILKISYGMYCLLMLAVCAAALLFYNLTVWLMDTWGALSIDEIIFHLMVPLEGTNAEMVQDGLDACLPLAELVLCLLLACIVGLRNRRKRMAVILLAAAALSVGIAGLSANHVYEELGVEEYLRSQKEEDTFIRDHYVDPRNVAITFPEEKRNLIYIYLESVESTYAAKEDGGAFERNCIPELTQLAQEYVNFSDSEKLGGLYPTVGTT